MEKETCMIQAADPEGIKTLRLELQKHYKSTEAKLNMSQKLFLGDVGKLLKDFEDCVRSEEKRPEWVENLAEDANVKVG